MARFEFKLPDIGEGVTEGEIVAWADGVQAGATIAADQALVEVMTDKATVTITSPKAGRIVELGGQVGQVIAVGKTLVVLEVQDGSAEAPAPQPKPAAPAQPPAPAPQVAPPPPAAPAQPVEQPQRSEPAASAVGDIREHLPGMPAESSEPAATEPRVAGERPLAAPATRKLARELGVDLSQVKPSGPSGRITADDVKAHAERSALTRKGGGTRLPEEPMRIAPASGSSAALEERVPLRGVRKRIFDAMARSKHTAAHFTFVEECDVTALKAMRERMRGLAEAKGVSLSFLPFIIKACVAALRKHPTLNSAYDEATDEIVIRRYYNIGLATATEAGLIVPVVKGADQRSLLDIATEIQRLSSDARSGKIKLEDIQGSTFTITSLGAQGGLFATPILNFPEVGILGVHQIKQKPVVRGGQIVVGDVMLLSLSFDHRLIDGHIGAAFAYEVIRYLENPDLLMLEAV
ncbi:MAG: 2-oxo acid dehydrogenase subunit E2 [Deltaproteobacteria bacterium]|nr:2-oxo acid dehydrogenase subunit E2 [Deltaproteobacteria bacterium]